jgi:hypothetical protein
LAHSEKKAKGIEVNLRISTSNPLKKEIPQKEWERLIKKGLGIDMNLYAMKKGC